MVTGTTPKEGTYGAAFQHIVDAMDHARSWKEPAVVVETVSGVRDRELKDVLAPVIEAKDSPPSTKAVNTVNRFKNELMELLDQGKVDEAIVLVDRMTRTEFTTFGKEAIDEAAYKKVVAAACDASRLKRLEGRMMDELGKVGGRVVPSSLNAYQVSSYKDIKPVFDAEKKEFIESGEAKVLADWVRARKDIEWIRDTVAQMMETVRDISKTGTPQDVHDYLANLQVQNQPAVAATPGAAPATTAVGQQQDRTTPSSAHPHYATHLNDYISAVDSWADEWLKRQPAEVRQAIEQGGTLDENQARDASKNILLDYKKNNPDIPDMPTDEQINGAGTLDEARMIARRAHRAYLMWKGEEYMTSIGLTAGQVEFVTMRGQYQDWSSNAYYDFPMWDSVINKDLKAIGQKPAQGEKVTVPPPPDIFGVFKS
ncbi:MAG: hypothetical protein M1160_03500 [Candidatus Marsarchaeota archaeon]|jgi:hypothetical protein|nr:hypothetical protein [Candidatus Marsarchaeota archaeon]MCL5111910.1 hypothetical protein [Candidatus Marsarchaeota archaeon]